MKVLLAVSGGIDSMYMANKASDLFPGASFAIAHCNFALRGEESDGDEAFVRGWCEEHGMALYCTRFDTEAFAAEKHFSIEMAARELRYGWFRQICHAEGFDAVAVAHNANDNAETLLLNMLRGTGTRGMRGMATESRLFGDESIRLLRPLLHNTREEIRSWMEKGGHEWREDHTNADSEFKRNRIRNQVFPLLSTVNPSFISTLNEDMDRLRQVDDIAEDYLRDVLPSVLLEDGSISVTRLLKLRHWKYVLWRLIEESGMSQQTFDKLTTLLERYKDSRPGTVTLSGKEFQGHGCVVRASGKRIEIIHR